jgi:shikimate kinase
MDQRIPARPADRRGVHSAISLVGFMGAGKTTVGHELAARIGWRFLDVDELIATRERRTIDQIFREDGERRFRELECAAVTEIINAPELGPVVLTLGGGAFIEPGIQQCLRDAQIPTVFLDAPAAELFSRCGQPGVERPLRRDLEQFCELYEQRRPHYLKAAIRVNTSAKPVAAVVQEIISALDLVLISGARD